MPVGNGPPPEKLEAWRPKLEAFLANPVGRCRHGGRVVGERRPDGTVRELDKWNSYSIRPMVYWAETGVYPTKPIRRCPDRVGCVDCGRVALGGAPNPARVAHIESEVPPPPPPVPAAPADLGPVVEWAEPGHKRVALVGPVPPSVPPAGSRVLPWLLRGWRWGRWPVAVSLVLVTVTALLQGVSFGVSTLGDNLPEIEVDYGPSTSTTPQ